MMATRKENTARSKSSPVKPTNCVRVLLVHTGRRASGPDNNRPRSEISKTQPCICHCRNHDENTDLQVHTGHNAEHQGPVVEQREHISRCMTTSKTQQSEHATAAFDDERGQYKEASSSSSSFSSSSPSSSSSSRSAPTAPAKPKRDGLPVER